MKDSKLKSPDPRNFARRSINSTRAAAVRAECIPGKSMPLVIEPVIGGISAAIWAENQRPLIESQLRKYGAVLFRKFFFSSAETFSDFVKAISGAPMHYEERSSPRSELAPGVYTSTDYPARERIFPHNEHSYAVTFPLRLYFCCVTPALTGGATPIADCRRVLARLSPRLTEKFRRLGWMYVRNFGDGLGLSWPTAFQTEDKTAVEQYCRSAGIAFEWKSGDRLRTWQVRPAIAEHPHTRELVWFNHATFFHVSSLDPATRDALLSRFSEQDLPNNTYYGDGSAIESQVLDELRQAYLDELVSFAWEAGDVLLIDNMLTAHSRESFTGPRQVLVAMAEPVTRNDAGAAAQVARRGFGGDGEASWDVIAPDQ